MTKIFVYFYVMYVIPEYGKKVYLFDKRVHPADAFEMVSNLFSGIEGAYS